MNFYLCFVLWNNFFCSIKFFEVKLHQIFKIAASFQLEVIKLAYLQQMIIKEKDKTHVLNTDWITKLE